MKSFRKEIVLTVVGAVVMLLLVADLMRSNSQEALLVRDQVDHVVADVDEKVMLATVMHDTANGRATLLSHMFLMDDPFLRDESMVRFQQLAEQHIQARDRLREISGQDGKLLLWQVIQQIDGIAPVMKRSAELLANGESQVAKKLWTSDTKVNAHREMLDALSGLREYHMAQRRKLVHQAWRAQEQRFEFSYTLIALLLLVLMIAGFIIYRFTQIRGELEKAVAGRVNDLQREIKVRREAEARFERLAHYDPLTNLPNRALFEQFLHQAVAHAHRSKRQMGVMFVDLDLFKRVNDTLGHAAGDQLLVEAASRIGKALRAEDLVARLGGDEFVVLVSEIEEAGDLVEVAERIQSILKQPVDLEGYEIVIGASIGIALYPDEETTKIEQEMPWGEGAMAEIKQQLLKQADIAMYRVKDQGRGSFRFYDQALDHQAAEKLDLESALRSALDHEQFELYYQPQLRVSDNRIVGLEALLRWRHDGKPIPPDQFIPVLESMGEILRVGQWVLHTACKQLNQWHQLGFEGLRVAVNLSVKQFHLDGLDEMVFDVLDESGLPPETLELEITESILIEDSEAILQVLNRISEKGVKVALDDFGTGYSSLSYLKKFNLDTNKIDRVFIRNVTHAAEDAALTHSIISMGHDLKMKVVAEGVETEEQLQFLRENGCDEYQGYLFSPPVPADQIEQLLKQQLEG